VAILQGVLGGAEALGSSVALDREVAVVGSPADNTVAMAAGRVLVYQRSPGGGGTWVRTGTLKASDGAAGDSLRHRGGRWSGLTVLASAPARSTSPRAPTCTPTSLAPGSRREHRRSCTRRFSSHPGGGAPGTTSRQRQGGERVFVHPQRHEVVARQHR